MRQNMFISAKAALASVFSILCAASAHAMTPALGSSTPLRVIVDPGHGGPDRGAVRGDLRESKITLEIALKLERLLAKDSRFQASLTRERDKQVALSERARIAEAAHADILLSIHANSNEDARANGVEIYFQNQLPANEESMFLAARENGDETDPRDPANEDDVSARGDLASILEDLQRSRSVRASFEFSRILLENWSGNHPPESTRRSTGVIRQAPFYLVSRGAMPAILVEVGFLTNPIEGKRLADSAYQTKIAETLFASLTRFKETVDKDRGRPLRSADAL